jgi:hypothetical protein
MNSAADQIKIAHVRITTGFAIASAVAANKWLLFEDVVFTQHADFTGLQLRQIEFYGCEFEQGVDLSGIQVKGDLIAYETVFRTKESRTPAIRLDGARVAGELRIIGCDATVLRHPLLCFNPSTGRRQPRQADNPSQAVQIQVRLRLFRQGLRPRSPFTAISLQESSACSGRGNRTGIFSTPSSSLFDTTCLWQASSWTSSGRQAATKS